MSAEGRALTWVVGAGGLLGSHVAAAVARSGLALWHVPCGSLAWSEPDKLRTQINASLDAFVAATERFDEWRVIWCAGAGVIGTPAAALARETTTLREFLVKLGIRVQSSAVPPGLIFVSSSAGGVWGGSVGRPLTEVSSPAPISAYGRAKLEQEEIVREWARDHPSVRLLIGRISNLYGPGQNLDKPQGLISHLCRCLLQNQPAHIYVPMDTIRDYLFADDCAALIVRCLDRLSAESGLPRRMCAEDIGGGEGDLYLGGTRHIRTDSQAARAAHHRQ